MNSRSHNRSAGLGAALALLALVFAASPVPAANAKTSKVDLNNATQAELEALPGVGAATAKKIIEGRPYSKVSDLAKAGVSSSTIDQISKLVKVGKPAKAAPAEKAASTGGSAKSKKESKTEESAPAAAASQMKRSLNRCGRRRPPCRRGTPRCHRPPRSPHGSPP